MAQSAVSRHVAALEAQLGQTLVIRGHRQIQLSRFQRWMGGTRVRSGERSL
ncbi:LysR family transcriptional regulator [Variovorax sp. V15]|uniref:helix-turn-helix domain-containing protein n=1 Tax=unclassified Variovorax TaxID=663243 RepID=UPI0034E8680A